MSPTKTSQFPTNVQLVSTFEWDPEAQVCTVLLSRKRVRIFRVKGYEACLVNTVAYQIQSNKVLCDTNGLREVGDADGFVGTSNPKLWPGIKTRSVTREQRSQWSRIGPSGGGGGMDSLQGMMNMMGGGAGIPLSSFGGGLSGLGALDDIPEEEIMKRMEALGMGGDGKAPGCPTQ